MNYFSNHFRSDESNVMEIEEMVISILNFLPNINEKAMIDFKLQPYHSEKMSDFISDVISMLNSDEGFGKDKYIIFGVTDTKYPKGMNLEEIQDDSHFQNLTDKISPRPSISCGTVRVDGKYFGYVYISKKNYDRIYEVSEDYKCAKSSVLKGQAFIRKGSKNYSLTNQDRERISFQKTHIQIDVRLNCLARLISLGVPKEKAETIMENDISNKELGWIIPKSNNFLIVSGDYGSGKTYNVEILYLQLQNGYLNNPSNPFPLWVNTFEYHHIESKVVELFNNFGIRELIIIVDGLDEISYHEADTILKRTRYLLLKYKNVRVILTSRPIHIIESLPETVRIQLLSKNGICNLMNLVAESEVINPNFLWTVDRDVVETLKRPFFAILCAQLTELKENLRIIDSSRLKSILMNLFIDNIFDKKKQLKDDFILLSIKSIDSLNKGMNLNRIQLKSNINEIFRTGLLIGDKSSFKFALPLVAQWLAAEALYLNWKPIDAVLINLVELYKWKYPLILFVYRFDRESIDRVFYPLIIKYPAFMGTIVSKGIDNRESGQIQKESSSSDLLEKVINVFREGLDEEVPVVFSPNFTLNITSFEKVNSIEYTAGFYRTQFSVNLNHENWYYYAVYKIIQDQIYRFIKKPLFINNTAMFGELLWETSCKLINNGPLRNKSISITELIIKSNDKSLKEFYLNLRNQGVTEICPPWPFADLDSYGNGFVWGNYSTQRLFEKTVSIFSSAINDYKKIVDSFFPGFRNMLSHYQMLPFSIKGIFKRGSDGHPSLYNYFHVLPYNSESYVDFFIGEDRNYLNERKEEFFEIEKRVLEYRPDVFDVIHPIISEGTLDLFCFNPVTKIVIRWLKEDFKNLEWIN